MNKYQSDDVMTSKIVQQLEISIACLDAELKQSLSVSRKVALAKVTEHSTGLFFNPGWKQATVLASALILVVTASIVLFSTDSETSFDKNNIAFLNVGYDDNTDAVIAEYELLNKLEFFSWLVEEDNENNPG